MEIFNLLRIFTFQTPEPTVTPEPVAEVTKIIASPTTGPDSGGIGGFFNQIQTQFGSTWLLVGLIGIVFLLFLLVLILLLLMARKARRKARQTAVKPPVTRPAAVRSAGTSEPDTNPPPAKLGFGLQLVLPGGEVRPLTALPATIGRGSGNAVVLDSETVSTIHASIYYDSTLQAVCIEDQNSLNGTLVNGKPTRKNILNTDDRITIGDITLIFQDTGYIPAG